jgi:ABC-type lipoprotein release transport system permease subunit
MQLLAFKALIRRKGTASAIVAIVLLVALVTAVNCLANNINAQTNTLTQLAKTGDTYIVTSNAADSLFNSQIGAPVIAKINDDTCVSDVICHRIANGTLQTADRSFSVTVHGIDKLQTFFRRHNACINGTQPQNSSQANAGVILSNIASVYRGDQVNLTVNGKTVSLALVGVVDTTEQIDAQLILPLATLHVLSPNGDCVSFVEFTVSDPAQAKEVVANMTQALPSAIKIEGTQQMAVFAANINSQMIGFINVWSLVVYVVVAATAYVVTSRVINEAKYEFYVLGTLGAKRQLTVQLTLGYALAVATIGCLVGLSAGIVGTQVASTFARWILGDVGLAPFLEGIQAGQILLFGFIACFIGCLYPALHGRFIAAEATAT